MECYMSAWENKSSITLQVSAPGIAGQALLEHTVIVRRHQTQVKCLKAIPNPTMSLTFCLGTLSLEAALSLNISMFLWFQATWWNPTALCLPKLKLCKGNCYPPLQCLVVPAAISATAETPLAVCLHDSELLITDVGLKGKWCSPIKKAHDQEWGEKRRGEIEERMGMLINIPSTHNNFKQHKLLNTLLNKESNKTGAVQQKVFSFHPLSFGRHDKMHRFKQVPKKIPICPSNQSQSAREICGCCSTFCHDVGF